MSEEEIYRILFVGDVVGRPGREALKQHLGRMQEEYKPLFTIVNGENAAGGVGITSDIAEDFFKLKVDAITLGNHAYNKKEIFPYLDSGKPIVRPINMPARNPGRGHIKVEKDGILLHVVNLCGRVYMEPYDDPFLASDELVASMESPHRFFDFHCEATSEKIAMGYHLDGRATAVVGTHTHVTTADERILVGGTATITDVGMTGPINSVLGMNKDIILGKFRTSMPARFEVANEVGVICGVVIDVERKSGRALSIQRVRSDQRR